VVKEVGPEGRGRRTGDMACSSWMGADGRFGHTALRRQVAPT
jgi:hypothetical protein